MTQDVCYFGTHIRMVCDLSRPSVVEIYSPGVPVGYPPVRTTCVPVLFWDPGPQTKCLEDRLMDGLATSRAERVDIFEQLQRMVISDGVCRTCWSLPMIRHVLECVNERRVLYGVCVLTLSTVSICRIDTIITEFAA